MKAMRKSVKKKSNKKKVTSKLVVKKKAKGSVKIKSQAPVLLPKTLPIIESKVSRFASVTGKRFSKTREILIWSLVAIVVVGGLSVLAFGGKNTSAQKESNLQKKIHQSAALNATSKDDEVTLIATGDVMLARYVELKMRKLGDYTYPFQKSAEFLKSADITFGNLETPFFPGRNVQTNAMTFRADLAGVQGLQFAGYDVMSIANNHVMNYQVSGLTSTLVELKKANILASGGGKNEETARSPIIVEVKGKRVAFLSYVDSNIPPKIHGITMGNYPGIARMDVDDVKVDIKNALTKADIVVVSMHAGNEYSKKATKIQTDFAHTAIDAGAAVVIGHHPHVVQPVENYGNGVILYSLGNFVFDQFFSADVQTGLVARITFGDDNNPSVELFPVKIEGVQPRVLEGQEGEVVMQQLGVM